jgi:hypothetical protein
LLSIDALISRAAPNVEQGVMAALHSREENRMGSVQSKFGGLFIGATGRWLAIRSIKGLLSGMLIVALCALPSRGAPTAAQSGTSPGQPAQKQSASKRSAAGVKNRHLHVPKSKKASAVRKRTAGRAHVPARRRRVAIHRGGGGTITGVVQDKAGNAVSGARVRLTWPRGRALPSRARHVTVTNSAGKFTMHRVRPRAYRVAASKRNIGGGHAQVKVAPHSARQVQINLAPARRRK